jgi:acetoin utilization deacetylase AcuC-like enzyme
MKPILWLDLEQEVHKGEVGHPESPLRIKAIQRAVASLDSLVLRIRTDPIPKIQEPASSHTWFLDKGDTFCTVYTQALLERGFEMIREATRSLALGITDCAYVCIRPPGHHATDTIQSGFCHQNNVWIAIEQLRSQGFHSIGVIDWDAHHGDGTEYCIRASADPNLRFVSLHAYGPDIFPGTGSAANNTDHILNVPIPLGTNSETYIGLFHEKVLPFLKKGSPDLLIVSAGYDGHEKDPMGLLQLREQTYTYMSGQLKDFDCPVLFLLEGGYNPEVLASCVVATLKPWTSAFGS